MSNDELPYGEQVICLDEKSPWYLHVGRIRGKNKGNVGVAYPDDGADPATGRWHPKRFVSPVKSVAAGATARLATLRVRHNRVSRDFTIELGGARHLVLTGPNGSGKTTLLNCIARAWHGTLPPQDEVDPPSVELVTVADPRAMAAGRALGDFVLVEIPASRELTPDAVMGPAAIDWSNVGKAGQASRWLVQYLVNRRTALAFAGEGDHHVDADAIRTELDDLRNCVRWIVRDPTLSITIDPMDFRVNFVRGSGRTVELDHLPSGWAAVLNLWAELLLTEEAWRQTHKRRGRPSGIVLIDELEKHLHLSMQEQVLGFLTGAFPNWQFIVATHSPVIPSSIPDALVYDLGRLKGYPSSQLMGMRYGAIMTGHFGLDDEWDETTTRELTQLRELLEHPEGHEAEIDALEARLSSRSASLAQEIWLLTTLRARRAVEGR